VCSLTVAAWDTLVLSPRTWKLLRTKEWPPLKIIYHFIRLFMPICFTVTAVQFFDTKWTQTNCQKTYLFEPITTAILLACCSAAHVIRIHAIFDKDRTILVGMGVLWAIQFVVTAVCCAFYFSVPLKTGQGCIAGPRYAWVGIYWVTPTLLYSASFGLALLRSIKSLEAKPLGVWKLMLRDGLNLYGAIWIVNITNVLFWFIIKPTGNDDAVRTIVTSMAAVLTTTMTMRIILSVRGSLVAGGSFSGSYSASHSSATASRATRSNHAHTANSVLNINSHPNQTYTIGEIGKQGAKVDSDGKSSVLDSKGENAYDDRHVVPDHNNGALDVKITVDTEVEYDTRYEK